MKINTPPFNVQKTYSNTKYKLKNPMLTKLNLVTKQN
jgi:hypothetical protein